MPAIASMRADADAIIVSGERAARLRGECIGGLLQSGLGKRIRVIDSEQSFVQRGRTVGAEHAARVERRLRLIEQLFGFGATVFRLWRASAPMRVDRGAAAEQFARGIERLRARRRDRCA